VFKKSFEKKRYSGVLERVPQKHSICLPTRNASNIYQQLDLAPLKVQLKPHFHALTKQR
jgi:hypothetical protein